jgi:putative oxidoreductase
MKQKLNRPKALHITLWVAQIILGGMFIIAGIMKSSQPIIDLSQTVPWAADVPVALVRFIGLSELLGGIGLILPSLLKIKPILTPVAAIGILIIMVFALLYHISKGETDVIGINIVLGMIAAFIAWGRLKKAAIHSRTNHRVINQQKAI